MLLRDFEVTVHDHQAGRLKVRMQVAAGSVGELEVGEDEEDLPLCRLVMLVALLALGQ